MSGISLMALPGKIPTSCSDGSRITPESLFKDSKEKATYQSLLYPAAVKPSGVEIKVKKVCVKIFDLSKKEDVEEYQKLWADLLEKTSRNEVIVESQKDLVRREDGTSYWMKYVEYVEFGGADEVKNNDGEKK